MKAWPTWWAWDLELSPHVIKRMPDRHFTEIDLRAMMEQATGLREDDEPGRWVVETRHDGRPWEVIVEPDLSDSSLVVITAYRLEHR